MAGARVVDLKTLAVWWLPTIASATLAPTVAEIAAGVNITCDIEKGSSVPTFTGDKTSSDPGALCEDTDIETVVGYTYGGELTFYRRFTSGAPATDDVISASYPAPSAYGYLVIREGYAYDATVAAAQKVDVFYVQAGSRQKIRGAGSGTIRLKQVFHPAGSARDNLAILA